MNPRCPFCKMGLANKSHKRVGREVLHPWELEGRFLVGKVNRNKENPVTIYACMKKNREFSLVMKQLPYS